MGAIPSGLQRVLDPIGVARKGTGIGIIDKLIDPIDLFGKEKKSKKEDKNAANTALNKANTLKAQQTGIAESQRQRRLKLFQSDSSLATQTQAATGRKTLVGQ